MKARVRSYEIKSVSPKVCELKLELLITYRDDHKTAEMISMIELLNQPEISITYPENAKWAEKS